MLPWQQQFERHVLQKFDFLVYFLTLNWIAMLGIKNFGHLEHYCFDKNVVSDFLG